MSPIKAVPRNLLALEGNPAGFIESINPSDLVYFLLNVGNGDAQLIVLPERDNHRRLIIVDIASFAAMQRLIQALTRGGLLDEPKSITVAVATHPHSDHIRGLPPLFESYRIEELWVSGYPSSDQELMSVCNQAVNQERLVLPTAGYQRSFGSVAVTVLAPSVALRHRFHADGFNANNSSITLMVEYPKYLVDSLSRQSVSFKPRRRGTRLVLGADAQTTSWAQVETDFPEVSPQSLPLGGNDGSLAPSRDYLRTDVLKVPHHGSKHGLNLELVERMKPKISLISCAEQGGRYRFPHDLAQEILREACFPTASTRRARRPDHEIGIHYTGARCTRESNIKEPLGTIALVIGPRRRALRMWRLCDDVQGAIDLSDALQVRLNWEPH